VQHLLIAQNGICLLDTVIADIALDTRHKHLDLIFASSTEATTVLIVFFGH
jgi:hypothetical protein